MSDLDKDFWYNGANNLKQALEDLKDKTDNEDLRLIEVNHASEWDWDLPEQDVEDFVDFGQELGADKFFYWLSSPNQEKPSNLLILFEAGGNRYKLDLVADWYKKQLKEEKESFGEVKEDSVGERERFSRYSKEVTEELSERKVEMIEEMREKENLDMLSEEQKIRIKHGNPEDFRFAELEDMKDRIFDAEEANEDVEDELAELVYEDEAFNSKYSQLDTETLLKKREDISEEKYDRGDVRMEMVHRKAKSLLKIED